MTNPKNEFSDIFNDPDALYQKAHEADQARFGSGGEVPLTIETLYLGLLHMIMEDPEFYKDEDKRLVVSAALGQAQDLARTAILSRKITDPGLSPSWAAFSMMLTLKMAETYEEYAGATEQEHFPVTLEGVLNNIKLLGRLRGNLKGLLDKLGSEGLGDLGDGE